MNLNIDGHIILKEIESAIRDLKLDLSELTILTEAATGLFALSPIIAQMAGAKKIYALSQDTKYGSIAEVCEQIDAIINYFNLDVNAIQIINKTKFSLYDEIDIVTNLGNVRPINEAILSQLKPGAIISYMCEAWEIRNDDIDLDYCKKHNISVFATNEDHPLVNCFRETG